MKSTCRGRITPKRFTSPMGNYSERAILTCGNKGASYTIFDAAPDHIRKQEAGKHNLFKDTNTIVQRHANNYRSRGYCAWEAPQKHSNGSKQTTRFTGNNTKLAERVAQTNSHGRRSKKKSVLLPTSVKRQATIAQRAKPDNDERRPTTKDNNRR